MVDIKSYEEKADLLKALAHPVRLCIVHGLMENQCNVNKMTTCLEMPQSTVSQQLGILRSKGIIKGKRQGTEICYEVVNDQVKQIVSLILDNELDFNNKQEDE
ncbi:MAG TPA: transcriptional regulator [Desulfotomaculum sp.]|nr:transcriptional regulator [Desulfotomaculum sp.]HBY03324.1 transcriptional regulator [Desulfotomaculum sp.]